jgi:hypothetical protein
MNDIKYLYSNKINFVTTDTHTRNNEGNKYKMKNMLSWLKIFFPHIYYT